MLEVHVIAAIFSQQVDNTFQSIFPLQ